MKQTTAILAPKSPSCGCKTSAVYHFGLQQVCPEHLMLMCSPQHSCEQQGTPLGVGDGISEAGGERDGEDGLSAVTEANHIWQTGPQWAVELGAGNRTTNRMTTHVPVGPAQCIRKAALHDNALHADERTCSRKQSSAVQPGK